MSAGSRHIVTQTQRGGLLASVRDVICQSRKAVAYGVNTAMVLINYEIGRLIVEHEQGGKVRAEYAERTLERIATRLTAEFGKGYSHRNLDLMRQFYRIYSHRVKGSVSVGPAISQKPSAKSALLDCSEKSATTLRISAPFALSWSHYVFLMRIENEDERHFYEIESAGNQWSLPELRRQFNSSLYERLALIRDKKKVKALSRRGQIVETPHDVLKDPYVLEFLGLREEARIRRATLRPPSSTGSSNSFLSWAKDSFSRRGRSGSLTTTSTTGWTWSSTTASCAATCWWTSRSAA